MKNLIATTAASLIAVYNVQLQVDGKWVNIGRTDVDYDDPNCSVSVSWKLPTGLKPGEYKTRLINETDNVVRTQPTNPAHEPDNSAEQRNFDTRTS